MKIKISLSLILLFSLFTFILTDKKTQNKNEKKNNKEKDTRKDKKLKLDEVVKGEMKKDESFEYYNLVIPNTYEPGNMLLFTVKETQKGVEEGHEDIFSDPDIYISKSLKYPKNGEEADWYSERYGSDIVTIPSYAVAKGEIFYITMYCQFKCHYQLKAYLAKEVEILPGRMYSANIDKKSSLNYFFNIPKEFSQEGFSELNLISYSTNGKPYKVFMAKEFPSSQNTIKANPSWMGGYIIKVNKNDKQYCTDCSYHILFQTSKEDSKIQFYVNFPDTITKVLPGSPINDMIEMGKKKCYSFDMSKNKKRDDEILIQTTLFSGSALLHISGWVTNTNKTINEIKYEDNLYIITSEATILLTNEDLVKFDGSLNKSRIGFSTDLNFCIYGQLKTSYTLQVYFLNEAANIQEYNYVFPGTEVTGYLHGGQVTSYSIINTSLDKKANITVNLKQIRGEPLLYIGYCESFYCTIYPNSLKRMKENNQLLYGQFTTFSSSLIKLEPKMNKCLISKGKICKILAYVECPGNKEDICSFKISSNYDNVPILMTPKKTYFNHLPKDGNDFYEIVINDPLISSAVIVLTSVSGDAQLMVSQKSEKSAKGDKIIGLSVNNDYIPDVVRITPSKLKQKNIIGKYKIKVFSKTFSSYNLYYYTLRNKTENYKPSLTDINVELKEGNIIKDFFPNDIDFKIYSYSPSDKRKSDIKIILTRINVRLTFYVYLNFDKIKYNNNLASIYDERLTGYDWISDSNNELTISKDDKKYSTKGPYYIVVVKDKTTDIEKETNDNEDDILDTKALITYYLGLTKEPISFLLNEGIEHSVTLSNNHKKQTYLYIHSNFSEPFQLKVNILSGEVDVFVNSQIITDNEVQNYYTNIALSSSDPKANTKINLKYKESETPLRARLAISDYGSIELTESYFRKFCSNSNPHVHNVDTSSNSNYYYYNHIESCPLYIYVVQSQSTIKFEKESQYLIHAKSSITNGIMLQSGKVYKGSLLLDQEEHYIIEEVKHREGTTINIKFHMGYGEVYVRVPEKLELTKNTTFPNENYYDYKGENSYGGKVVIIPAKVFDKINEQSLKVQIFITVKATGYIRRPDFNIEYSISYSSEAKRINQNVPYSTYIGAGEYQYYTFYFGKNTQNIYISLSNMNGDADMYLNHGNDLFPTPSEHDWFSNTMGHEYIDISKDDPYFKKHQLEDASGYYTLLVLGYTNTTYTLYISGHDENIYKLFENSPLNCKCQKRNDKCYYRYDKIFSNYRYGRYQGNNNKNSTEIIFTTQYLYGNGKMYASIYKEHEIYGDSQRKKYSQYFPSEKSFQFSNSERGKRNYMKVFVSEEKYSQDSVLLMTFICEEKTDVEIVASHLSSKGLYYYIMPDKENIFYLEHNDSISESMQEESIFNYYSYKGGDLIYEFHAYLGQAKVLVYTNETNYNYTTKISTFEYNHIADFVIQAQGDNINNYRYPKTFVEEYINSIPNYKTQGKTVYFKVKPLSNFGFYIQLLQDRSWINIPLGKSKTYLIKNQTMNGYFDIYDEFSSVEVSITLEDYVKKKLKAYLKVMVINKNSKDINSNNIEDKLYHYEIPSEANNDYKGETSNYLGTINININDLPNIKEEDKDKKIVRAILVLETSKIYSSYYPSSNSKYSAFSRSYGPGGPKSFYNPESTVQILITPGFNNFKRIETLPFSYYFSNTSLIPLQPKILLGEEIKTVFDGRKEVKIYTLDKIKDSDDKMLVQINSCSGNYKVKFSSKIVDYDDNANDIIHKRLSSKYGRTIYLIEHLQFKHIYLSIMSNEQENCIKNNNDKNALSNNEKCSNELSYLLYYYSTDIPKVDPEDVRLKLKYRKGGAKQLWIKIPSIHEINHKIREHFDKDDIEYNLVWTKNSVYYYKMESICYLGQLLNMPDNKKNKDNGKFDNSTINIIKDIKLNEKNEYLLDDIEPDKKIYINVLARNIKTNEITVFIPLRGVASKISWLIAISYISGIGGIAALIVIILLCNCKRKEISVLDEVNNLGKSDVSNNYYGAGQIKYSNIAKDYY